jgi:hypothetical protein
MADPLGQCGIGWFAAPGSACRVRPAPVHKSAFGVPASQPASSFDLGGICRLIGPAATAFPLWGIHW